MNSQKQVCPICQGTGTVSSFMERPERIELIIKEACGAFETTREDLLSGRNFPRTVAARRRAVNGMHAWGYTLREIGEYLNMHHTSIVRHIKDDKDNERRQHAV